MSDLTRSMCDMDGKLFVAGDFLATPRGQGKVSFINDNGAYVMSEALMGPFDSGQVQKLLTTSSEAESSATYLTPSTVAQSDADEYLMVDMDGKWVIAGADNVVGTPMGDGIAMKVTAKGLLVFIPGKGLVGPFGSHQITNLGRKTGNPYYEEDFDTTFETNMVKHASGAVSTKIPPFHLTPYPAHVALANRFGCGVRLKGDAAWNAIATNYEAVMQDRKFLIERLGHGVDHCLKAIARLNGQLEGLSEEEVGDGGDAGAIMFAGALLACVEDWERRQAQVKAGEGVKGESFGVGSNAKFTITVDDSK